MKGPPLDNLPVLDTTSPRACNFVQIAHFLGVGVVLDSNIFPGFRHAFEPAQIPWDIDPAPLKQRAVDIEKGKIKSTLYTSIS